jgi:DNA-binding winged helix-turn-helix (wHTH) protein/TolB-like protein
MDPVDAGQYRFGEFELDESVRSLTRSGERVALSAKAFDLLVELVKRRGSVATKNELLESVWPNQFVEENNLSVQISALRKLLGEGNGGRRFIETVPGRGYVFVAPVEGPSGNVVIEQRTYERIVVEDEPDALSGKPRSHWLVIAIVAITLIAAGAGIWFWRSSGPASRIDSLAVLPFQYQGQRPDADYLSDGVTEALINNLSQIPNLTVKARGSVFQFKGQDATPQTAAAQLDVQAIVLGKIVESGDNLAINIELVNAANGNQIWGQRYERKLIDLVTLSNEIATDVASKLRLRLGAMPMARGQTKDPQAYDLYLRGRFLWNKRRQADHERALELFEQAIARDPNFALAYAAVGDVCVVDSYKCPEGVDCNGKARQYATKALAIEPNLGEPYATLGNVEWSDRNWSKADENYLRSMELNPGYGDAHHWRAEMLTRLGRHDEAVAEIKTALQIDPLSLIFNSDAAYILIYARKYEEGLTQARRTREMNRDWTASFYDAFWALEYMERYEEALDEIKGHPFGNLKDPAEVQQFVEEVEYVRDHLRKNGKSGYWRGWLDVFQREIAAGKKGLFYSCSVAHVELGEDDKAIEYLGKSVEEDEDDSSLLNSDPHFDRLKSNPGYIAMLKKMKFIQ